MGKLGFLALQKCTSTIRQLALGSIPDAQDEYLQMSERVSRDSLNKFCRWVIKLYGREYLRRPTRSDIHHLYRAHEELHGFPGMLGSIDCTHWQWANCPTRWRGQFMRGDHSHPTIMLEAVASQDLWIWHAFFGVSGANNDLNVLHQSPLLNDIKDGIAPECPFEVNNNVYAFGYYLGDGIYPEEATFAKAYKHPASNDVSQQRFKKAQEASRKDMERAFGVLKKRLSVVNNPARAVKPDNIKNMMYACILLHNMILKDEEHAICPNFYEEELPNRELQQDQESRLYTIYQLKDRVTYHNLRYDLKEHIARTYIPNVDED